MVTSIGFKPPLSRILIAKEEALIVVVVSGYAIEEYNKPDGALVTEPKLSINTLVFIMVYKSFSPFAGTFNWGVLLVMLWFAFPLCLYLKPTLFNIP